MLAIATPLLSLLSTGLYASQWQELSQFGANPGELDAWFSGNKASEKLLVVLHGCKQDGRQFSEASGLLAQAEAADMLVLVPQQRALNNLDGCFSWFNPADQKGGEAASIIAMINGLNPSGSRKTVFLVGLSAGGAMASNLADNYPQYFKAVAVVAGVPHGCANSLVSAISCMKSGPGEKWPDSQQTPSASWPDLVVVTGSDDDIVNPRNSKRLVGQWRERLGLDSLDALVDNGESYISQSWRGEQSRLEYWELTGFPHAWSVGGNARPSDPYIQPGPMDLSRRLIDLWTDS
ncbi:extracellular catalytic domain type 1 short-chain-length polyhydroxyalkanoate depolymerase [Parahaliea maris]|uniref:extracellular catalytic domain type 1 short-chain-length polyhydroxyalkanoate depolymerase n=1 Tax=Parahaliea maris TaxID=2716870 RepID=UPI00164FF6F0|nr:PHB depolymerase family esterase [Parahaliea maris]